MNTQIKQSQSKVAILYKYYATNRAVFMDTATKEDHVRTMLIDPLLELLGWDVTNKSMVAPQYREVITEDSLEIEGHQKAPDYTVRVGTLPKFYVEAKKCSINISRAPAHSFQLRRYGWNAKLPLSILTNFETFSVYDCTSRPNPKHNPSRARILVVEATEYADRWEELYETFSRDAVWSGAHDNYARSNRKRGTSAVDLEFLKEIESWRDTLARHIAIRNKHLQSEDLNSSVQKTIDRLIFLRIAEDRGLEPYESLLQLCAGHNIYKRFIQSICRNADEKYNSGLFHFRQEPGNLEPPDKITPKLIIDDSALKPIIQSLYFAHGSPYHFGILPVEILGTVYEQFLGKVIRLTPGHRAKIEEKPAIRKAGGIYYTPEYIVDYIVKNTVATAIINLSPMQLAGSKSRAPYRVLDMSCGSGSFLLCAYGNLLNHCLSWYRDNNPALRTKAVFRDPKTNDWKLTNGEKKRILTTHIFGVDIDPQAVEVTKLALLIKALEGETDATLTMQMALFEDRVLPNLFDNIKRGDSLIDAEYLQGQMSLISSVPLGVDIFDWSTQFSEIIATGGFDCIIGNPPYGADLSNPIKSYLKNRYPFVSDFESAQYFLARASELTKDEGYVGFILPNTLFLNVLSSGFREFISSNFRIETIADLTDVDVFKGATVRTTIPILRKNCPKNSRINVVAFRDPEVVEAVGKVAQGLLSKDDRAWVSALRGSTAQNLMDRIEAVSIPLGEILEVSQGLIPYDKYRGHDENTIKKRIWHASRKKNKTYRQELRGGDVRRYSVKWNGEQWISYGPWLAAPRKPDFFLLPRLLFREITDQKSKFLHVAFTDQEFYNNPSVINCISRNHDYNLYYILGICASRLIAFLHYNLSPKG